MTESHSRGLVDAATMDLAYLSRMAWRSAWLTDFVREGLGQGSVPDSLGAASDGSSRSTAAALHGEEVPTATVWAVWDLYAPPTNRKGGTDAASLRGLGGSGGVRLLLAASTTPASGGVAACLAFAAALAFSLSARRRGSGKPGGMNMREDAFLRSKNPK